MNALGKKIILVDQDGVLADFEKYFLLEWRKKYPDDFFVPLEKRQLSRVFDEYPENLRHKVSTVYMAPGFFINIPPMPGAIAAMREGLALDYDMRICTSPLTGNPNCIKEKMEWIEKHLGKDFTRRTLVTSDKTLVRGNYLIDDKPVVTGTCIPEWERVIFDAPYNRKIQNPLRVTWDNWKQVLWL